MKLLLLIFVAVFGAVISITHDGDLFDKLDIQSIFESNEKRRQAFDCLMDRAPCGTYQEIKEKCPDILRTDCANCSPSQKTKYQDIMRKLEVEHNAEYREMVEKYRN